MSDSVAIIENNFKTHQPNEEKLKRYSLIREKAKELALLINDEVSVGREKSLAFTSLEQSVFWANAGIARNK